jgi:hypothetical protein
LVHSLLLDSSFTYSVRFEWIQNTALAVFKSAYCSCFSATSTGKVLSTCNSCRTKGNKKRKALQELDPNLPSKRHVTRPKTTTITPGTPKLRPYPPGLLEPRPVAPSIPKLRPNPPSLLEQRPVAPSVAQLRPNPPRILKPHPIAPSVAQLRPNPPGLLELRPTTPSCLESRSIPLSILESRPAPPLQIPQPLIPCENGLLSAEQWGRYRGHQYHYSGHCVSFMQNIAKTVNILPNLPSELDIVVLRPSNQVMESDQRYQRQFRSTFRVRKGHVLTWLQYLKVNRPDYQHVTISLNRLDTLPVDDDVFLSFVSVINNPLNEEAQAQPVSVENAPLNSQSMVPNLNITATEIDLILQEISGLRHIPPDLPAPEVRSTPIDEAAGSERIFAMAFPTLYPTGTADFNTPRIRHVSSLPHTLGMAN